MNAYTIESRINVLFVCVNACVYDTYKQYLLQRGNILDRVDKTSQAKFYYYHW